MLSRKIPKLKLYSKSKGEYSNDNYSNLAKYRFNLASLVNKYLLLGIPVLSIALLWGGLIFAHPVLAWDEPDYICDDGYKYDENFRQCVSSSLIDVGATIALTIGGDATDGQIIASPGGGTVYRSHTVRVQGSNVGSYNLMISGPTSLTGTTAVNGANNKTGANLSDNTWGYAWGEMLATDSGMTYHSLASGGTTLASGAAVNNTVDFTRKLNFAAKFASNAVPGHYRATVNLALTATPRAVVEFTLTNMQDMTVDVCKAVDTGVTKRLKDTRNNKYYWVTKMADGNCWMTQNLDFDLAGQTLVAGTSNVTSNWASTTGNSQIWNGTAASVVRYYDAGNYVYTTPLVQKLCGTAETGTTGLANCTGSGWVNVEAMTVSADADMAEVVSGTTYNAHYLSGNYYSWAAATVARGPSAVGTSVQDICPKGWKLPLYEGNGSYANLLKAYKLNNGMATTKTVEAPLYFTRTGYLYNGRLYSLGSDGTYWTASSSSTANAYDVYFGKNVYYEGTEEMRGVGFPVRCVALGA